MRNIREQLERVITLGKVLSPDILTVLKILKILVVLLIWWPLISNLHVAEAQMILETLDPIERLHKINDILTRELEIYAMQAKIKTVAKDEINKSQKEYFLREQIKAIKSELGDEGVKTPMMSSKK